MSNDPVRQADGDKTRQADIQRRLANLAKAPRCGAKTRAGVPCRQAAVLGRRRCRMHGGAKGSGGPAGPGMVILKPDSGRGRTLKTAKG